MDYVFLSIAIFFAQSFLFLFAKISADHCAAGPFVLWRCCQTASDQHHPALCLRKLQAASGCFHLSPLLPSLSLSFSFVSMLSCAQICLFLCSFIHSSVLLSTFCPSVFLPSFNLNWSYLCNILLLPFCLKFSVLILVLTVDVTFYLNARTHAHQHTLHPRQKSCCKLHSFTVKAGHEVYTNLYWESVNMMYWLQTALQGILLGVITV